MELQPNIIVLDGDGVMLDYNLAYGEMFKKFYNETLPIINPRAYSAFEYYGMSQRDPKQFKDFMKKLHSELFWGEMPALPGALNAVNQMTNKGYQCICVTSMPKEFGNARLNNLKKLGFPIETVFATNNSTLFNPKKEILQSIHPAYFVDDLLRNFEDLELDTKLVLLSNNNLDNPQTDFTHIKPHLYISKLEQLSEFLPTL